MHFKGTKPKTYGLPPTLIVGMGSTGVAVASRYYGILSEELGLTRKYLEQSIRMLLFNTHELDQQYQSAFPKGAGNVNFELCKGIDKDYFNKFLNDNELKLDPLYVTNLRRYINQIQDNAVAMKGAASCRMLGRIVFLGRQTQVENILKPYVKDMFNLALSNKQNIVNVWVVGSLSGGTTSGGFLELAALLRKIEMDLKYETVNYNNIGIKVAGLFTGPQFSPTRDEDSTLTHANFYAAIMEHMSFWTIKGMYFKLRDMRDHQWIDLKSEDDDENVKKIQTYNQVYLVNSINEPAAPKDRDTADDYMASALVYLTRDYQKDEGEWAQRLVDIAAVGGFIEKQVNQSKYPYLEIDNLIRWSDHEILSSVSMNTVTIPVQEIERYTALQAMEDQLVWKDAYMEQVVELILHVSMNLAESVGNIKDDFLSEWTRAVEEHERKNTPVGLLEEILGQMTRQNGNQTDVSLISTGGDKLLQAFYRVFALKGKHDIKTACNDAIAKTLRRIEKQRKIVVERKKKVEQLIQSLKQTEAKYYVEEAYKQGIIRRFRAFIAEIFSDYGLDQYIRDLEILKKETLSYLEAVAELDTLKKQQAYLERFRELIPQLTKAKNLYIVRLLDKLKQEKRELLTQMHTAPFDDGLQYFPEITMKLDEAHADVFGSLRKVNKVHFRTDEETTGNGVLKDYLDKEARAISKVLGVEPGMLQGFQEPGSELERLKLGAAMVGDIAALNDDVHEWLGQHIRPWMNLNEDENPITHFIVFKKQEASDYRDNQSPIRNITVEVPNNRFWRLGLQKQKIDSDEESRFTVFGIYTGFGVNDIPGWTKYYRDKFIDVLLRVPDPSHGTPEPRCYPDIWKITEENIQEIRKMKNIKITPIDEE